MKEYLKMADVFGDVVAQKIIGDAHEIMSHIYGHICVVNTKERADIIANAINSHDELVAEVERLTKSAELAIMTLEEVDRVLTERIKNGAYDLDDISGEVTYALDKLSARE